ncbi:MAG: hypothetical protein KH452_00535 [Clostridiales bacterium]|nr:hypothetical protein [Clostridiales bacterium]
MTRRKNGFFTFLCSLIPGAGEMHLGFMKEGVSIMGITMGLLIVSSFLHLGGVLFLLPMVWFYSFFNVHNKAGMSDEEFYALKDDYLFHMDQILPKNKLNGRQTVLFGWILVICGISIIWWPVIAWIRDILSIYFSEAVWQTIWRILYDMPKYVIAVLLILHGVRLIKNKKKELDLEESSES